MPSSRILQAVLPFICLLTAGCDPRLDLELSVSGMDDISALELEIDGVDLLDEDGENYDIGDSQDLDLAEAFDGETLSLLSDEKLAEGRYTGLRLSFSDSVGSLVQDDGGTLDVEADSLSSYTDIDLEAGEDDALSRIVVLELRFSLSDPGDGGTRDLRPYLRVLDPDTTGSISGSVAADLVEDGDCRQGRDAAQGLAVYAFEGEDVEPVDFLSGRDGPVASTPVRASGDGYVYDFAYLEPGTYTLALSCDADGEDPLSDDGLSFEEAHTVTLKSATAELLDIDD